MSHERAADLFALSGKLQSLFVIVAASIVMATLDESSELTLATCSYESEDDACIDVSLEVASCTSSADGKNSDESDADDDLPSLECCSWSSRCASPGSVASIPLSSSPGHLRSFLGSKSMCSTPRRSPRAKKRPPSRFMFKSTGITEDSSPSPDQWNVDDVLLTCGCRPKCALSVHGITAYDLLWIHSEFSSLPRSEQRLWILEYLSVNCPNAGISGMKDVKGITFLVCGKRVCQTLWLKSLPLFSSRFYSIRSEFLGGVTKSSAVLQRRRGMSTKSLDALSWMEAYFRTVGDKRPDKHGIYLPTCLTEKSIYHRMVDEKYNGNRKSAVCFSQFNKLFRKHFPYVTIPKVSSNYKYSVF